MGCGGPTPTSTTTSDTFLTEGYLFTVTRDKLFTGGVGLTEPIGRSIRVPWPDGMEAQSVTSGPNLSKATISIRRLDGQTFAIPAFTVKLLANTSGWVQSNLPVAVEVAFNIVRLNLKAAGILPLERLTHTPRRVPRPKDLPSGIQST